MELPEAWRTPAQKPTPPLGKAGDPPAIELPQSKALSRLSYRLEDRTLLVEFRSGAVYRYFGVSPQDYDELLNAPSPGARFNQNIQPYHEWERVA